MGDIQLTRRDPALTGAHDYDFGDLRAVYVNCTLTRSPDPSHTQTLIDRSSAVMAANGVSVDHIGAVKLRRRARCVAGYDPARRPRRRVAPAVRARHGRRHPGRQHADLAR